MSSCESLVKQYTHSLSISPCLWLIIIQYLFICVFILLLLYIQYWNEATVFVVMKMRCDHKNHLFYRYAQMNVPELWLPHSFDTIFLFLFLLLIFRGTFPCCRVPSIFVFLSFVTRQFPRSISLSARSTQCPLSHSRFACFFIHSFIHSPQPQVNRQNTHTHTGLFHICQIQCVRNGKKITIVMIPIGIYNNNDEIWKLRATFLWIEWQWIEFFVSTTNRTTNNNNKTTKWREKKVWLKWVTKRRIEEKTDKKSESHRVYIIIIFINYT